MRGQAKQAISGRGETFAAIDLPRIKAEESLTAKAYSALKQAIIKMDVYSSAAPVMLDEREISERIGVSRTPIREALAKLEQDGFVRVAPRRGVVIVRKTKREIIEMVQAWAALESMAVRLLIETADDTEIAGLRALMDKFSAEHRPDENVSDYSAANIAFHQMIIRLSNSSVLAEMTDNLLLHVRGIRALTIGRHDRAKRSIEDHLAIIAAIEQRDIACAERLSRDGLSCAAIHGNKSQAARTRALADFKQGRVRILVATDIAARGLDISELPHVVNFELPHVPEDYVHRIGRTGRAGLRGQAVSFVSREERDRLRAIEKMLGRSIPVAA